MLLLRIKTFLIVLLILFSCKEYGRLKFISREKTKNTIEKKLMDDKIILLLYGGIGSNPDGSCAILLDITVEYPKLVNQLFFQPDSIIIIYKNEEMVKACIGINHPIKDDGYYYISITYHEKQGNTIHDKEKAKFKILLSNFIYYNDNPILLDTIHACY